MDLQRRKFVLALGASAAVWPLCASGQTPRLPTVGILSSSSRFARLPPAFRQGLNKGGYFEGRNVAIEYRWAEGQYERLPALAAELLRHRVRLIVAVGGTSSGHAAKAATQSVPILFVTGTDPVRLGLVTSLSRPGGNATGVSVYTVELAAKRLELLRELVPRATVIAMLVNPDGYATEIEIADMQAVTRAAGQQLLVLKATESSAPSDFEAAFATAVREKADALFVSADPFFARNRRGAIVELAARYALPVAYPWRTYADAGGLMSYGPSLGWAYQQIGLYAARILNGAKPGDLPVQLPTKFELVINLKAARALGLTVSRTLLAGADELVE